MENLIDETEYNRLTNDGPEGKMAKTLIKFIANFAQYGWVRIMIPSFFAFQMNSDINFHTEIRHRRKSQLISDQ